MHSMTR